MSLTRSIQRPSGAGDRSRISLQGAALLALALMASAVLAAAAEEAVPSIVGVSAFPPYVMETDGGLEGFDIDIWNEVAETVGVDTTYRVMDFESLLEAIEEGSVDVGLGGISITHDRELTMDFSVPYMNTGLRILTRVERDPPIVRLVRTVSTRAVLWPLLYLVGFVVLCAHILYLAEHGSPAVNDRYIPGIFEASWCVLATITTVGYGDIAPGRWLGRFVSFLVMVIGISLFGVAIAELSSGLTMVQLRSDFSDAEDLRGRAVATVSGSTSLHAARRYESRVREVPVIEDAYDLLKSGEVDAVLFDAAPLLRYAQTNGNATVTVVGPLIDPQYYGIAFPQGGELREAVNRALLKLSDTGRYEEIFGQWFGTLD